MSDIFKGIADPTRRQILDLLAQSPLNVNQIHEKFAEISRPAVSQHLKILEDCGLLKIYQAGRERYGYLHKSGFYELNNWLKKYLNMEKTSIPNEQGVFLEKAAYQAGEPLTQAIMLQAMLSKDAEFDGVFYNAVKTTGIFCKPSCSANPKPENVLFFLTREEALKNGFRACKRCKP
jgi:DNA-binding transcriptional ArsR family regulator